MQSSQKFHLAGRTGEVNDDRIFRYFVQIDKFSTDRRSFSLIWRVFKYDVVVKRTV